MLKNKTCLQYSITNDFLTYCIEKILLFLRFSSKEKGTRWLPLSNTILASLRRNLNVMFPEKDTNLLDMGNGKITLQHMIGLPSNTFSSSSDN